MDRENVLYLIGQERIRQERKFGNQQYSPGYWMLILMEEVGEAAQAFLQGRPCDGCAELIQAAAVIVAWLESIEL